MFLLNILLARLRASLHAVLPQLVSFMNCTIKDKYNPGQVIGCYPHAMMILTQLDRPRLSILDYPGLTLHILRSKISRMLSKNRSSSFWSGWRSPLKGCKRTVEKVDSSDPMKSTTFLLNSSLQGLFACSPLSSTCLGTLSRLSSAATANVYTPAYG